APRPPRRAAALAPRQTRGEGLPRQARALGGVRRLLRPERGVLRRGARPRPAAARARRGQGRPHRHSDDAARAAARHALRLAPGGGRAVGPRDRRGRPRAAQALRDVPRLVLEARAPAHVGDERLQRLGRLARGARAPAAAALRGLRSGVGEGAHQPRGDRQHAARHGGARAGRARSRARLRAGAGAGAAPQAPAARPHRRRLPPASDGPRRRRRGGLTPRYRGAIRSAPSSRIVSPLSIGFSMIDVAICAYSPGSPSRWGNGIELPSASRASSGSSASSGVSNRPGAIVMTRMPYWARSRAAGTVMPTMPPFEAE